jgi:hypothetical protein
MFGDESALIFPIPDMFDNRIRDNQIEAVITEWHIPSVSDDERPWLCPHVHHIERHDGLGVLGDSTLHDPFVRLTARPYGATQQHRSHTSLRHEASYRPSHTLPVADTEDQHRSPNIRLHDYLPC